jgi:REP element-mobilizing transposase RayT
MQIFGKQHNIKAVEELIAQAKQRLPMRVLAWCVMPNHWHFVLWPEGDGHLSVFMRWLTAAHTRRWQGIATKNTKNHKKAGNPVSVSFCVFCGN